MAATAPEWLLASETDLAPCALTGRRRRRGFLEKTIQATARFLQSAIRSEETASEHGLLQRLDARVKLVSLVALLLAAALVRHVSVLLALLLATLALAVSSRLPLRLFLTRAWLYVPLFTGIVVAPAALSFVTPGEVVVSLGHWFGHPVGLTHQGLESAALVVSRVTVSISLVVLVAMTTSWPRLLAALRTLLCPKLLVLVIGMTYRFLFTLLGAVEEMYVAREARPRSSERSVRQGRAFVFASVGALFGKTQALSEDVHQAMVARGYDGDARMLERSRLTLVDVAWIGACILVVMLLLGVDRAAL